MLPNTDYYHLLAVRQEASDKEIKRAYRSACKMWHPDKNKSPDATVHFQEIKAAYDVLSDGMRRAEYDLSVDIQTLGLAFARPVSHKAKRTRYVAEIEVQRRRKTPAHANNHDRRSRRDSPRPPPVSAANRQRILRRGAHHRPCSSPSQRCTLEGQCKGVLHVVPLCPRLRAQNHDDVMETENTLVSSGTEAAQSASDKTTHKAEANRGVRSLHNAGGCATTQAVAQEERQHHPQSPCSIFADVAGLRHVG